VTTSSFQEIKRIHEAERLGEISEKISKLRPGTPDTVKIRIAKAIFDIAEEQDMSVDLIIALAREESNIDPSTPPSSAGAIGMLQVMPFWAKVLPFCRDLYDLKTNVRCGTYIYSFYRGMFKSDEAALVAYNQGPRSVKRSIREGTPVGTAYSSRVIAYLTQLSTK
jgi:soluble lytic murein transglycosylase-like protein